MLTQHTFSGDSLCQFIQDYQDHLEWLEDQLGDLIIMTNHTVHNLQVANQVYHQDLARSERLIDELLIRVMVLEGQEGNPIEIPDSPAPVLIPLPGGNLLVKIMDRTDNDAVQAAVLSLVVEAGSLKDRLTDLRYYWICLFLTGG